MRSAAQTAAPPPSRVASAAGDAAESPTRQQRTSRERLYRYPDRGVLAGVGAGIAEHLGLDVQIVRFVMALLLAVGGIGVIVYVLAWALIPAAPQSRGVARSRGARGEAVLIGLVALAVLVGLRHAGLLLGDSLIWPLVLGTCGLALVWRPTVAFDSRQVEGGRFSPRTLLRRPRSVDLPRLVIGGLLVAFAAAWLLHATGVMSNLGRSAGAVAIVATLLGLLFAPWFVRLGRSLAAERAARIREQERAELAAHLHDSVLQTLALIQNRAEHPSEVATLARRQERELRRWLFERTPVPESDSVKAALERSAAEVEELHGVPVELVVVGDCALDDRLDALVQATREAMTNASKFAAVDHVAVYAEIGPERVAVFVRDRGTGFDPAVIPPDRRGVRDSIVGRIERHGGRATIRSEPGAGTEVELAIERSRATRGAVAMSPVDAP